MKIVFLWVPFLGLALSCGDYSAAGQASRSRHGTSQLIERLKRILLIENGARVSREDFPAVGAFLSTNLPLCSAIVVGPKALLTAEHCVGREPCAGNGDCIEDEALRTGHVFLKSEGEAVSLKAECLVDIDADLALCHLAREAPVRPERFNESTPLTSELLVAGFGCDENGAPPGQVLRTRSLKIQGQGDRFIQLEPGLCEGDSGGPAYLLLPGGSRVVAGVNKSSESLAADITSVDARNLISRWEQKHQGSLLCRASTADPLCGP
jgi:Trypsin